MNGGDLQRFHKDLAGVIAAQVPLEFEPRAITSRRQKLAKLNSFHEIVSQSLPHLGANTGLPSRYLSALQVFAATGQMTVVLDGLAARGIARQQLSRLTRWPLVYVATLLIMSLVGLTLFWNQILPTLISFRGETRNTIVSVEQWDYQAWLPTLFIGYAIIGSSFLLFLLTGGFMRILGWFGGQRYLDLISAVAAQRTIPLLLAKGLTHEQAIQLSCELSGISQAGRQACFPTVDASEPSDWLLISEYWMNVAQQRLQRLNLYFPIWVVSAIGGLLILLYAMAIFGPIIATMRELTGVGT